MPRCQASQLSILKFICLGCNVLFGGKSLLLPLKLDSSSSFTTQNTKELPFIENLQGTLLCYIISFNLDNNTVTLLRKQVKDSINSCNRWQSQNSSPVPSSSTLCTLYLLFLVAKAICLPNIPSSLLPDFFGQW